MSIRRPKAVADLPPSSSRAARAAKAARVEELTELHSATVYQAVMGFLLDRGYHAVHQVPRWPNVDEHGLYLGPRCVQQAHSCNGPELNLRDATRANRCVACRLKAPAMTATPITLRPQRAAYLVDKEADRRRAKGIQERVYVTKAGVRDKKRKAAGLPTSSQRQKIKARAELLKRYGFD